MINEIIQAIALAINKEFGEEYKIYAEEIKQGLKEPCFFIFCINPTHNLFLGRRYFRENQFCIHYIPKNPNQKRLECNDAAERLENCLEYINIEDPMRGEQMHYEIEDGVLHFFVNYNCFVDKKYEGIPMEDLSLQATAKGE